MAYFGQGRLESTLTKLRIETDQPSPVELKHRELQLRMTQTEQRAARLGELVQKFEERNWRGLLETIRICVPDRLWLTHVRLTAERQRIIGGAAYDESLVYQFRKDVEGATLFESATIVTTTSTRHGNTSSGTIWTWPQLGTHESGSSGPDPRADALPRESDSSVNPCRSPFYRGASSEVRANPICMSVSRSDDPVAFWLPLEIGIMSPI